MRPNTAILSRTAAKAIARRENPQRSPKHCLRLRDSTASCSVCGVHESPMHLPLREYARFCKNCCVECSPVAAIAV